MTVYEQALAMQDHRLSLARRLIRHADKAHRIATNWASKRAMIYRPGLKIEASERVLARNFTLTCRSQDAFDLARKLYARADSVLTGRA